jgi:hypothetical protein
MVVTTNITVCWSCTMHALWNVFEAPYTAQILINFVTDFCLSISDVLQRYCQRTRKKAVRKININV